MTSSYSIEKTGNDYVVKVDDQSVMTVGNRRTAARLVAVASGLLEQTASPDHNRRAGDDATGSTDRSFPRRS
jgi:hypothetical protein